MRRTLALISIVALTAPLIAGAQSTGDTATLIQSLLAQIAVLEQELQQLQGSGTSTTPATPSASAAANSCPDLTRSLSLGMSGDDVLALQNYLVSQAALGASGATGEFDIATQQAVQKWQSSHGLVSSGDPATTGFGVVGPHTRALIKLNCANAVDASNSCPLAPQPTSACAGTWSAMTNTNGCTIAWKCSVPISALLGNSTSSASGTSSACTAIALTCPAGEHDQADANCAHTCVAN